MKIVVVYKTSKGCFKSLSEASKKCNREKTGGFREPEGREDVISVFAIEDNGLFFELKEIKPK